MNLLLLFKIEFLAFRACKIVKMWCVPSVKRFASMHKFIHSSPLDSSKIDVGYAAMETGKL